MIGLLCCCGMARAQTVTDWQDFKLEYSDSALLMSATLDFEVSKALEDAMTKGVALYFVAQADIYRERWYFYDKRQAHVERYVRLSYLPLSRRWRVNVANEPFSTNGLGVNVGQNYESLEEAMMSIRRISQWQLASRNEIDLDGKNYLSFKFKLDTSLLPRPLQMGAAAQSDWNIDFSKTLKLSPIPAR
jgi:hypothetical protein